MFEDDERELTVTMGITVSGAVLDRTVLFKKLLPAGSRHTREQVRAAFTLKAAQGLLSQGVHMAKEGGRNRIVVIE
jgi:hypothetical protein